MGGASDVTDMRQIPLQSANIAPWRHKMAEHSGEIAFKKVKMP